MNQNILNTQSNTGASPPAGLGFPWGRNRNHDSLASNLPEFYTSERIQLGENELAIRGVVDLSPTENLEDIGKRTARLLILDVSHNSQNGKYGPYDIDGSGQKRFFDKPYVIVNASTLGEPDSEGQNGTKYLEVDGQEEVSIGRGTKAGRALGLGSMPEISREHVKIFFDKYGDIEVQDQDSTNGIATYAPGELVNSTAEYDYTAGIPRDVKEAGKQDSYKSSAEIYGRGHGMYENKFIIARDTEINRGIYPVGSSEGEAIIVDDVLYPKELNKVYEELTDRLSHKLGIEIQDQEIDEAQPVVNGLSRALASENTQQNDTKEALKTVLSVVYEALRYDAETADSLASNGDVITLNRYIQEGVGVCRQQALLSAYLVERLIKNNHLSGAVSIDRNLVEADEDGHAWARFRDKEGRVFIIDPAQEYAGPLLSNPDEVNWDYRRTEDIIKQLAVA